MLATVWPVRPMLGAGVPRRGPFGGEAGSPATVLALAGSAGPVVGTTWNTGCGVSSLTPKGSTLRHAVDRIGWSAMSSLRGEHLGFACGPGLLGQGRHHDDRAVDAGRRTRRRWSCRPCARCDPVASLPPSGRPSRIWLTGIAMMPSSATTPTTVSHGCRVTSADVPAAVLLLALVAGDGPGRPRRPGRRSRGPASPRRDTTPGPHQGQHGRADGDGDDDGDRDRGRGDQTHLGQERQAGDHERGEGDDDGHAREDDGVAGGADASGDRLLQVVTAQDAAAVPVDDEQRVVDADGQAQHQRQRRGRSC